MLAFWALWACLAGVGVVRLSIDTSTSSFLDRADPAWSVYQASVDRFGGDEFVAVAIRGQEPFDAEAIALVARVSAALGSIPGVRRVDSIASVGIARATGPEMLRSDPLFGHSEGQSGTSRERLRDVVRASQLARGTLLSRDERTFALNVLLDRDVDADRAHTVAEIRSVLDGLDALVTGVPVFRTEVNTRTQTEVMVFAPVTLLAMTLLIASVLRSWVAVLAPLVVGGVGSLSVLGVMGFVGVPLSLSTMILPSILVALGSAYAMHVVLAWSGEPLEVARSLKLVARPVAVSGLTTALGFLAMATVPIDAIRELATYGALGVFVLTAASLTLVPAFLVCCGRSLVSVQRDWYQVAESARGIVTVVGRYRRAVLAAWGGVLLLAGVGIGQLNVSTDIIRWFGPDSRVRADYVAIRDLLSGITPVNIVVESKSGDPVSDPAVVHAMAELASDLRRRSDIGSVISIASEILHLHSIIAEDRDEVLSRAAIDQYLLLLGGGERTRDLVTADQSAANMVLRVNDNSSERIVALETWVDDWWSGRGVEGYSVATTGIMYEFARAEEAIAYGQLFGLALAAGAIALILVALMRSVALSLIAMLPNAVPIGIGLGAMGLFGLPLDAATVCLGSLALGVAVDDTIHVMTWMRGSMHEGMEDALTRSLGAALPAILLTTAAVAGGFMLLGFSDFVLVSNLGLVTGAVVILCLIADLTLLPALLLTLKGPAETAVR